MKLRPRITIVNFVLVLSCAGFASGSALDSKLGQAASGGCGKREDAAGGGERCGAVEAADPRVAKAHENLADYYSAEGRYAEAEKVYQKTLELKEDMLGRANPAIIPAVDDVARVSFAQMKYDQAADLIARELRIMEREYGDRRSEAGAVSGAGGRVLEAASKYPDAEKFLARAIAIREKSVRPGERGADAGFEPTGARERGEAQSRGGRGVV